ncbi:3-deoxy-7-phosphoheptulonate synthase [Malassezia yamatoensis]|uniref:Phospho-2-dehydro-3-deoxyheptonate aldolase n=1 Tax=Malassezia yamatoensis TaxID=253288 RepID=A0AAJ5YQC1_9BASI|nr:3-deoxy-7-phosphoheptulonate synthase [Malassezia yamatoensis]
MSKESWREKRIEQDVQYPDNAHLQRVLDQLGTLPGLVTPFEIDRLRNQMAEVAEGNAFLLQCGDCAELFSYCNPQQIEAKLKLTLLMSLILIHGARLPVVRIGRMGGQYAKPRSKPTEVVEMPNGEKRTVLSFRGDNVNGLGLDERVPNPDRLLSAYFHSTATLNYVRSWISSGYADLHAPQAWSFYHVQSEYLQREFSRITDSIVDTLDFMKTVGADPSSDANHVLNTVDYFISHEGLMLEYESKLTRETEKGAYDLSAHTIWLGDRTRQLDGAHIEFFRSIRNPIGIKVGPSMSAKQLIDTLDIVNPDYEKGRVTLISRYGAQKINDILPEHIRAVQATKHNGKVIWCCDPMHGNTVSSPLNPSIKTRIFADIVTELTSSLRIHAAENNRLGGVHLELTGDEGVTECIGGSMQLSDEDLSRKYLSYCDPRLNYEQSLDIAFILSEVLRAQRKGTADVSDAIVSALAHSIDEDSQSS